MYWVSVTRLRIRSVRYLPGFFWYAFWSDRQARKAPGYVRGIMLPDQEWTFWTQTVWESREAMREFRKAGSHRAVMPKLVNWCDEASVAHWEQESDALVSWEEADQRMRTIGAPSKVRRPSIGHASLRYRKPKV